MFAHVLILASLTSLQAQTIRYVKEGGSGEGLSWDDASGDLLAMINASQFGSGDQVWVAKGIYKPGSEPWHRFELTDGVSIYGGFEGGETSLAERVLTYPSSTTLSGEIGDPGTTSDNSYHVVACVRGSRSTILDGFVITGGNAHGEYNDAHGGGVFNESGCGYGDPIIRNCYFTGNQASSGGGFYSEGSDSHPLLINCVFFKNTADGDVGGGAMTISGSEAIVINCTFVRNRSTNGNAIQNKGTLALTNSILWNNLPSYDGEIQGNDGLDIVDDGTLTVTYTINQDNLPGLGNQVSNPAFANEADGDLSLTSCSFAINSGNLASYTAVSGPDKAIAGENRVFGGYIDRGAFEFQGETDALFFINPAPLSLTICATPAGHLYSSAQVTFGLGGKGPVTYAFYKDGVKYDEYEAGVNDATFFYTSDMSSGAYRVVVSNACGSITSEPFSLTVLPHPTVTIVASTTGSGAVTVLQNTSPVSLTASGCEGTLFWTGPGSPSGSSISIPTSTTGTFAYSVYCQEGSCISPTASFTVIVNPAPTVTGSFDGFLYGADCSTFRGWAWDRNKPNTVFSVDLYDGATFKGSIAANEFRQDLKDAGKGNGIHAFRWTIPEDLKDGQVHSLSARIQGSSFTLKEGPKTIQCQTGTPPPPANKPPVAPTMSPLVAQQGVDFITTLPVFTDPEGGTLSYGLAGLPTGLTFTSGTRQITGKPGVEGGFVLTYSATDAQNATNSVSFNLTVAGSTPIVTGSFEGYLDKVECGTIRGWVWDRNKPNTPLTVEFYTIDAVLGSVVANIYRVDLKNAGKGNGAHAYSFEVPAGLKDGNTRLIRARVSGSTYDLKDSGKPLNCPSPVRLSAEPHSQLQVTVLGNPVSDQVVIEIRGAESQPLRFQLSDASGRLLHEHQIGVARPVERQTVSIQHQPPGLLLLRVDTRGKSHTLKILKR
ncbi:putative Ig domain-containing protein [Larkinella sp.]|uniref:putative Ig domain-containing protein n=1 Tax=Larkinella sp. TaxID=2034517 RepID=UPI003BAC76F9